VARNRQALRCSARRTDGQPCGAYAITGGTVCAAHGGSAPAVRASAELRYWSARTGYAFDTAYKRWRGEVRDWQVQRVLAAAWILGVSPVGVTEFELGWLAGDGRIPGEDTMPAIRVDRRYGPRTRTQLATRAARQAARKAADDRSSA
jgi:hypothetical protein